MIEIPIKKFSDGLYWLLLSSGLETKGFIFRADSIEKDKKRLVDYDNHHCDQASATGSVKCRAKSYFIMDKVLQKPEKK